MAFTSNFSTSSLDDEEYRRRESQDVDFDELYAKRYKRYLHLLAKVSYLIIKIKYPSYSDLGVQHKLSREFTILCFFLVKFAPVETKTSPRRSRDVPLGLVERTPRGALCAFPYEGIHPWHLSGKRWDRRSLYYMFSYK